MLHYIVIYVVVVVFLIKKNIIYILIHVDVFVQAVRHGDIYARSEIWNNNNNVEKKTVQTNECEAEHICVWALTHLLSIYRSHERVKLLKTLFLFD